MSLVIGAILALFSAAILAYPFFKPRSGTRGHADVPASPTNTDAAPVGLDSVYEAIRALELDYQLGKVPEALYQDQVNAYRVQAAVILQQQARQHAGEADPDLEQEIRRARSALQAAGEAALYPQDGTPQDGTPPSGSGDAARCPRRPTESPGKLPAGDS